MLSKVKLSLRITNKAFDDEINGLIESAKIDLLLGGVSQVELDTPDPLIERAVVLYCKAHFGLFNPDSVKYEQAYNNVREKLLLSGLHNAIQ